MEEEDWAGMPDLTNFWDESAANQEIVEGLMEEAVAGHEADMDEVFLWEERKPILDLLAAGRDTRQCPDEISFVWMDSDTITGLINMQDEEEVERFPWEDPQCIRSLLCHNSVTFPEDDVKETSEDETEWNSWPFWGEFGTTDDIINAYEINFKKQEKIQQINIEEAFWEISLEKEKTINSHSTAVELPKPIPKDPVNIFKSAKHIFNIPQEARARKVGRGDEGRHLFEDMEDVYGDWAKLNLSDERAEKKRQTRGRGKEKPVQAATRTGKVSRLINIVQKIICCKERSFYQGIPTIQQTIGQTDQILLSIETLSRLTSRVNCRCSSAPPGHPAHQDCRSPTQDDGF